MEDSVLLVDSAISAQAIVDPKDAAESAGLRYVSDARPGIRRKKAGKGFNVHPGRRVEALRV